MAGFQDLRVGVAKMLGEPVILAYGLSDQELKHVRECLPTKAYELYDVTDAPTDLLAVPKTALIINPASLGQEFTDFLMDSYAHADGYETDTAIWLGGPQPSKKMNSFFKFYSSFHEIRDKLKYLLLSVHKLTIKAVEFSNKIALALMILRKIHDHPGISTRALSDKLEINPRSIQRYINSLRMAGEFIEYDMSHKGWKLFTGRSILLGDSWEA